MCEGDAGCNASCEANASADVECTKGTIAVSGGADVEVVARIQANMDAVWQVKAELVSLAAAIETSYDAGVALSGELTGGCIAVWAGELEAKVSAAFNATISVEASVSASTSVSGSAG